MKTPEGLRCKCGGKVKLEIGYSGADRECKAGEGSGFGWELDLMCQRCGTVHALGHLKSMHDISERVD